MSKSVVCSLGAALRASSSVPRLASPAFALAPARLRHVSWFNTSAPIVEPLSSLEIPTASPTTSHAAPPRTKPRTTTSPPPPTTTATSAPAAVPALLPLLAAQPKHYITVHIHGKPYLVTPGDSVRLPFKMPGVLPGDVLRLDRATAIGSRDFTLQGRPYVSGDFFECRATVVGTDCEPMRLKVVKKRRNRRSKTIKSKHYYTTIRISELKVIVPEIPASEPTPAPGYSDSGIVWS